MTRRWLGVAAALGLAAGAAGCGGGEAAEGVPANPLAVPNKKDRNKMAVDRDTGTPTTVKASQFDGK